MNKVAVQIKYALLVCILVFSGSACTKYTSSTLAAMEISGVICNSLHYRCNENSGSTEAYQQESDCSEKMKADLETFIDANKIKIKQDDLNLCTGALGTIGCADLKQAKIEAPAGCESLSAWFAK